MPTWCRIRTFGRVLAGVCPGLVQSEIQSVPPPAHTLPMDLIRSPRLDLPRPWPMRTRRDWRVGQLPVVSCASAPAPPAEAAPRGGAGSVTRCGRSAARARSRYRTSTRDATERPGSDESAPPSPGRVRAYFRGERPSTLSHVAANEGGRSVES